MLGGGKARDKFAELVIKPILRLLCGQHRHCGLRANNQRKRGHCADDDLRIIAQRLQQVLPIRCHFGLAFGQHLLDQFLERLTDRCIRNIALELIEFTFDKNAAIARDRFLYFMHQRGFADTGIAGYQHEL